MELLTAAHPQGPHGQHGLPTSPGPLGGGTLAPPAAPMLLAPGTQQGGALLALQAPGTQQGGAQIAVQPSGGAGVGPPQTPIGVGATGPPTQECSGIAGALERLASYMTDADTSWSLRWQRNVNGDATELATWKVEATAILGLQVLCLHATR